MDVKNAVLILGLTAIAVLFAVVGVKSAKRKPTPVAAASYDAGASPKPGLREAAIEREKAEREKCAIGIPGERATMVPVFPTEDGLNAWTRAATSGASEETVDDVRRANSAMLVQYGTRCAFVGGGFLRAEVLIDQGPHRGRSGFIPREWSRAP